MTKRITKQQYWQLTGLLALAKATVSRLTEIEYSIRSILGVRPADDGKSGVGDPQHIEDAVYSGYSVDQLMEKLGVGLRPVSVQPAPLKTAKQQVSTRRNRKAARSPQSDGKSS